MTGLAARLRPAGATGSFDRRLIAPMVLGATPLPGQLVDDRGVAGADRGGVRCAAGRDRLAGVRALPRDGHRPAVVAGLVALFGRPPLSRYSKLTGVLGSQPCGRGWWIGRGRWTVAAAAGRAGGAGARAGSGPGAGAACGVCRTDLHLAEGDLPPKRPQVVPGHEVVGVVDALGPGRPGSALGDRVGVPWLGGTDGSCRFCRRGAENLCLHPTFTGWDVDGGYAEPAWCGRSTRTRCRRRSPTSRRRRCCAPGSSATGRCGRRRCRPAGRSGSTASAVGPPRRAAGAGGGDAGARADPGEANRRLARALGADSAGESADPAPEPLDGAVLFAPAGELVPVALRALDRGGTLAVAGIWLSDIPALAYAASSSRNAGCAASPRTPARTARSSSAGRPAPDHRDHRRYDFDPGRRGAGRPRPRPLRGAAVLHVSG